MNAFKSNPVGNVGHQGTVGGKTRVDQDFGAVVHDGVDPGELVAHGHPDADEQTAPEPGLGQHVPKKEKWKDSKRYC